MPIGTRLSGLPLLGSSVAFVATVLFAGAAFAQAKPDSENGRFTMSPAGDGFVRLDTRTGAVSNCAETSAGWACYAVPDERAALDSAIGRLQADNDQLKADNDRMKAELAARPPTITGKTDEALPKSDSLRKSEPKVAEAPPKVEIPLPSDQDVDRVMSFMERAWRRLIEMANRVQRDVNGGKI